MRSVVDPAEGSTMGVDLRKDDDGAERAPSPSPAQVPWVRLPAPVVAAISAGWPALWILLFIVDQWQVALVLLFLTAPLMALLHGKSGPRGDERRQRRLERHQRHQQRALDRGEWRQRDGEWRLERGRGRDVELPSAAEPSAAEPSAAEPSAAERSLAATLVRAETSAGRLDPDALALVREVDVLLRPLLARVRSSGADPQVRRDLDTIATEHLPAALGAYLLLPADYAREHRTVSGTTPTDELRSQLTLLLEGCRQLRDAIHDADVNRQQELSRFLEAKFRRSDLAL